MHTHRLVGCALISLATLTPSAHSESKIRIPQAKTMKTMPAVPKLVVQNVVRTQVQPFDLADVRLLDSPFKRALERNSDYLLSLEADRLLSGFRKDAGLEPKASLYGGWEARGVAGHSLGHYLTAIALIYRATGDERFRERASYIIDELALTQDARGSGYLGAYEDGKRIWSEIGRGEVRSAGFDLNGGWVPWYTNHKVFAGLRDVHLLMGNAKAKDVLVKFSDWAIDVTKNLDDAKWQRMLGAEFGGMNEVLADVYAITGDKKYLELAEKFTHRAVIEPLAQKRDELAGKHANTQIPKIIGNARIYELTGDQTDATVADFFWKQVIGHHSYANGGNSDHEHFGAPDKLANRLTDNSSETCNTYNMLKLTRHLFSWQPSVELADYHERALFNHILASQNPDSGMVTYYVPLQSGGRRTYSTPFDSFWCCTGSGMESHVKYGDAIYFRDAGTLWVNNFIASEVNWRERGLTLRQETKFPESDVTRLTVSVAKTTKATIKVRCPGWLASDAQIKINGKVQKVNAKAGTYAQIARDWKNGDVIEVRLPMQLRTEAMPDDKNRVAFLYGPILLAGDVGENFTRTPVLVSEGTPKLQPIAGAPLMFRTNGVAKPNDVTLQPFYKSVSNRYAVYWDVISPEKWQVREAQIAREEAEERALLARRTDEVRLGEQQPEIDHNLQSQNSSSGRHQDVAFRHTATGGWFAVEMKVDANAPMELACRYWGDENGAREFDIMVDGKVIATPNLARQKPGEFYTVTYPIPQALTQGKSRVTVRFQSKPGNIAGGVFGCWMLKAPA